MATDYQNINDFYVSLRDALVVSYEDKSSIKDVAVDAGIDWGDVNPDGSARSAWGDVILNARKQGRIQTLIEQTAKRNPQNDGIQRALIDFGPPYDEVVLSDNSGWPSLPHHTIDRQEQLDPLSKAVHQSSGRPLVAIWCGDDLARHDIMCRRVKDLELRINGHELSPLDNFCRLTGNMRGDIQRSFLQLLSLRGLEESESLSKVLVGQDFSQHLLLLTVNLIWGRNTPSLLTDIMQWCSLLGALAEDRRFVIAVAIEVPSPTQFFEKFWSRVKGQDRVAQVKEAHSNVSRLIADHDTATLLLPLSDVQLAHLRDWRAEMEGRWGTRPDDKLGDPRLIEIIPHEESRPMQHVVDAFDAIFS